MNSNLTPAPAIHLDSVGLTLRSNAGPVEVLRDINLSISNGETVGVVGPSGSGKTSLLMIIAGLETPTAGRVSVAGQAFDGLDENALARIRRDHIGIVFQNFHLLPTMTALENVALPLEFAGLADAFDRAREGLTAVGLAARTTHYPGQLSGGEQQRVALARAFAAEPQVLLADEPTGSLDGSTGAAVIEMFFNLQARCAATLVLVTHAQELASRCARIVRFEDGQVADDGISGG